MTLSALSLTLLSLQKSLRALTIFRRFLRKFRTKYPLHNRSNPTFTWCLLSPLCSHWLRVGVNSPVHPLIGKHSARNNPRGPNPSTTSLLWPGSLILTPPHQERYLSLQFRSSRTLVHDLEHCPRVPAPAIKIPSRSGPIIPTTATLRARLAHTLAFEPPMLPLFLCAHLFDFRYMPPPLSMLFLAFPPRVPVHRWTYAPFFA